jgi:dienelactone hydrolase
VVSFHRVLKPPGGPEPQAPIAAKVLVLHGWEDPMALPADVLALARELTEAGADGQLHAHGHAMHAFTHQGANNPQAGVLYDAAADRRSWAAMRGFLEEVLEAPPP